MIKSIKQNFVPFAFLGLISGLLLFPIHSHISQKHDIVSINSRIDTVYDDVENLKLGDDFLVGASTLFAQNASVQLNFEALGTYASVSGNFAFQGEIMPDGASCSNGEILKKTGANNWDCAADDSSTFDAT